MAAQPDALQRERRTDTLMVIPSLRRFVRSWSSGRAEGATASGSVSIEFRKQGERCQNRVAHGDAARKAHTNTVDVPVHGNALALDRHKVGRASRNRPGTSQLFVIFCQNQDAVADCHKNPVIVLEQHLQRCIDITGTWRRG